MTVVRTLEFVSQDGTTAVMTVTAPDEQAARVIAIGSALSDGCGLHPMGVRRLEEAGHKPYWKCAMDGMLLAGLATALLATCVSAVIASPDVSKLALAAARSPYLSLCVFPFFLAGATWLAVARERRSRTPQAMARRTRLMHVQATREASEVAVGLSA